MIKVNGGEKEDRKGKPMSRKKKKEADFRQLFIIILGFVFAAFGLLLLLTPANYPIGNFPTTFNPLLGIILIAIGLVLLFRSD